MSMGFVRLPTSSQTSPVIPAVIQSETSEATSRSSESTSGRPEMQVDDISKLGLVPESPNQPSSDYIYPKTKFGDSYRSFKTVWTTQFTWLHYNESTDSAFCWYCKKATATGQLKSSKREDAFINRGYTNWKNAIAAFRKHEQSDCHKEAVETHLLPQQCGDIAKRVQESLSEERRVNRAMLFKIIRSIKYLARQGLALRGHSSDDGNLIQLLKMQSETDPALQAWLKKEREKYTSGEIQNEILQLMAHSILRKVTKCVHINTHYGIMQEERHLRNYRRGVACDVTTSKRSTS